MLSIDISKLTDQELDMLGDIAVEFGTHTIVDTIEHTINFAIDAIDKAHELGQRDKLLKLINRED